MESGGSVSYKHRAPYLGTAAKANVTNRHWSEKARSVGQRFPVACAIDARVRWLNRLGALSTDRFGSGCSLGAERRAQEPLTLVAPRGKGAPGYERKGSAHISLIAFYSTGKMLQVLSPSADDQSWN